MFHSHKCFFSVKLAAADIAETIRRFNTTVLCVKPLRSECKKYNFSKSSYKDQMI